LWQLLKSCIVRSGGLYNKMENVLESQGIEAPAWVQDLLKQMQQVVVQQDQKIQGLQEQLQAYTVVV
jgi:hypothetical protein